VAVAPGTSQIWNFFGNLFDKCLEVVVLFNWDDDREGGKVGGRAVGLAGLSGGKDERAEANVPAGDDAEFVQNWVGPQLNAATKRRRVGVWQMNLW
jgi:hypothetical protein